VDWQAIRTDAGAAEGRIALPLGDVAVTYSGEGGAHIQLPGGTAVFFDPPATYLSPTVTNPPPPRGAIAVSGDAVRTHTVTFATPVKNPVVAVWSVGFGSLGLPMEWEFEAPPALLSSGTNSYNLPPNLTVSGRRLRGVEGNGVIEFTGTFDALRFTLPVPEPYPGFAVFTVGVRGRG
jgi:hypothetical protein